MAFTLVYTLSGGRPLVLDFTAKDTETLHEGDFLMLDTGEADLATTNFTRGIGVLVSAKDPNSYVRTAGATFGSISAVDSTTVLEAVANHDAVYTDGVTGTAHLAGVGLDIAGATAAQVFAAIANTDFMTIKSTTSGENPLAVIATGEHYIYG